MNSKFFRTLSPVVTILATTAATVALSGCAMGNVELSGPVTGAQTGTINLSGRVHGGQQPVSGSVIQLYAAGATGYGSSASGLISPTNQAISGVAKTDANGNFNITGTYTCPTAPTNSNGNVYVYLTATGGNPGLGATNSNIQLVAALGTCANLLNNSATTSVFVDEVTTVAAAFALGQYASGDNIGAPNTVQGQIGLANAFATVNNLVNTATGNAQTSVSITGVLAVPEFAKLNTIADILAACVNSQGISDPVNSSCVTLFADVFGTGYPSPVPAPTDTFEAAVDMSLNPTSSATPGGASNIPTLYGLAAGIGAPYAAGAQPSDWTIGIAYTTTSLPNPQQIAVDAAGNVWVASNNGTLTAGTGGLTELSPTGAVLNAPATLAGVALTSSEPRNLAIDATPITNAASYSPNVYTISALSASALLEYNPTSNTAGTAYLTSKSVYDIAFDTSNNLWLVNGSSTPHFQIDELPAGRALNATATATGAAFGFPNIPSTSNGLSVNGATPAFTPWYLAFDSTGSLWISSGPSSSATEPYLVQLSSISTPAVGTGAGQCNITASSTVPCFGPASVTGTSPYLTTSSVYNSSFGVANYSGVTTGGATQGTTTSNLYTYTTSGVGGLNGPLNMAAAAGGVIWVANSTATTPSITKLTSPTAGTNYGATTGGTSYVATPANVVVDGSGDVWVSNKVGAITSGSVGGSVSEFNSAGIALSPASTNATTTNPGFVHGGLNLAVGIAIDLSGNVWVADNSSAGTVVEIVGAATPIVTPLALQLTSGFGRP
jgi:hypothetical protein